MDKSRTIFYESLEDFQAHVQQMEASSVWLVHQVTYIGQTIVVTYHSVMMYNG